MTTRLTTGLTTGLAGALAELVLGVRLALGGGRRGWGRLALTAVGIGVGVAVLLLAASVPAAYAAHQGRLFATDHGEPAADLSDGLLLQLRSDSFRGDRFSVSYVEAGGPHAPVPPGLRRIPAPGELAASAAMARLLADPDAGLLRARYPRTPTQVVGDEALSGPAELVLYVGAAGLPTSDGAVLRFVPADPGDEALSPLLWVLLVVGVVVLLAPVIVFVAISARLSGAERDRTLAAVRLVGCSIAGTRRIAAGEALAGALLGLGLGTALFLLARPLAEHQAVAGFTPFAGDLVPPWSLIALVVLGVPALAVATTVLALRRTLIEPLGVTRQAAPVRRRLWWRLLVPLAGVALLLAIIATGLDRESRRGQLPLVAGVVLVLLGVPALLPWALDGVVRRGWSATPALQLATGRLRAESGTPARVVAGLGVVLAGAIGLSSILAVAGARYGVPELGGPPVATASPVGTGPDGLDARRDALAATPGVRTAAVLGRYLIADATGNGRDLTVVPCPTLQALLDLPACRDGQVFEVSDPGAPPREALTGRALRVTSLAGDGGAGEPGVPASLPAPLTLPVSGAATSLGTLVATPGALPDLRGVPVRPLLVARYDPASRDVDDRIRAALAPLQWRAQVTTTPVVVLVGDRDHYADIRRGLFAGTLLTLALAAATMVVAAVEQVRERRRPLAVLAAAGVSRLMLVRSLLWQNAVPLVLAVGVADVLGVVLGALVLRLVAVPVEVDVASVVTYSGVAVLAAAAATALTLPAVVRATRPTGLRAE